MFYYIKGTLVHMGDDFAAIDCGGVCYKLNVSGTTYSALASKLGAAAKLYTYLNVREDVFELYGFATEEEQDLFKLLIGVSGVGPKAACAVLTGLSPEQLISAVNAADARAISRAQGIGLKTAQKIILELKDKISGEIVSSYPAESSFVTAASGGGSDAVDTLAVLGYTRAQAVAALKGIDPTLPLETIIGEALKKLASM